MGSKPPPSLGLHPRKSLVSSVPQPALTRTRRPGVHLLRSAKSAALRKSPGTTPFARDPPKYACSPRIAFTSSDYEGTSSFPRGALHRGINQSMYSPPATYGSLLSTRCPVQSATQPGAPARNCVVPKVS